MLTMGHQMLTARERQQQQQARRETPQSATRLVPGSSETIRRFVRCAYTLKSSRLLPQLSHCS